MKEFNVETIGTIDHGIDGKSSYLLITAHKGEQITKDQVVEHFQKHKYQSRYPGDWFCDMINFVWEQYQEGYSAIVTINHRMDI